MKPLTAFPRQPFLGLAMSAMIGILTADNWPHASIPVAAIVGLLALITWFARSSVLVYALVAGGFFLLHSIRTTGSPGMKLARSLGDEPRPVTVRGAVITEPRISERGASSFLLQAESIEI